MNASRFDSSGAARQLRQALGPLAVLCALAGVTSVAAAAPQGPFRYVSPVPGSHQVSIRNNVAIRDGRPLDRQSLAPGLVTVEGDASGAHAGRLTLSDDLRTLIFEPDAPYAPGEKVRVTLGPGLRTVDGATLPGTTFDFTTGEVDPQRMRTPGMESLAPGAAADGRPTIETLEPEAAPEAFACTGVPNQYPAVSLIKSADPDPGRIFLTPFSTMAPGRIMMLDNLANPIFYRQTAASSHDLTIQPDGRLTYFDRLPPGGGTDKYFALDSAYAVVDSFAAGNGYLTDSHELRILPNGHALLMIYDQQRVRMDLVVPGGNPNAAVVGLVIQEIDTAKEVVFQWRSWDHFAITDLASPSQNLTGRLIDYVHGNSLDVDTDGNLLLSSRHLNEVTKIDRETGEIIWRWGLHARNNDFTFINDSRGFSHQHHVRRLPNGHITLFDNGNYLTPTYSRALEYVLDEEARTATLVWEYRHSPDRYASFLGSVVHRPDGGVMIAWGGASNSPKVTDLNAAGEVTFELGLATNVWTYRAYRFPWRTPMMRTDEAMDFDEVGVGSSVTRMLPVRNDSNREITIGCALSTSSAFEVDGPFPVTLPPGATANFDVTFHPDLLEPYSGKVYLRVVTDTDIIAQDVVVSGMGVENAPPECAAAFPSEEVLWPPQHAMVPVEILGVTDPDGDPITIEIDAVTQDEPVDDGGGPGGSCPDAARDGGIALLRAERSAAGNGRVYHVAFTARDGRGGVSHGEVAVCVPHDLRSQRGSTGGGVACVDDGQTEDALACSGARDASARPDAGGTLPAERLEAAVTAGPVTGAVARVMFVLPADGRAVLEVFDPMGRRVRTVADERRAAGRHTLHWDASSVAPGVYFYRLRAGTETRTRAFVVLH